MPKTTPQSLGRPATTDQIAGLTPKAINQIRPFFLAEDAGPEQYRYVLWIDIMGSQGKMLRSIKTASIPLMKLHVAALNAIHKNTGTQIELFPVIDGIYVVCEHFQPLMFFITDVFRSMGSEFLVLHPWEQSVIRGAIAYGPVMLGKDLKNGSPVLQGNDYADSVLLGMPLVQAFVGEKSAPPFGIFVHESARAFAPANERPVTVVMWRWWESNEMANNIARALLGKLDKYYAWCKAHTNSISYPVDRIVAHQGLAHEYFSASLASLSGDIPTKKKLGQ